MEVEKAAEGSVQYSLFKKIGMVVAFLHLDVCVVFCSETFSSSSSGGGEEEES